MEWHDIKQKILKYAYEKYEKAWDGKENFKQDEIHNLLKGRLSNNMINDTLEVMSTEEKHLTYDPQKIYRLSPRGLNFYKEGGYKNQEDIRSRILEKQQLDDARRVKFEDTTMQVTESTQQTNDSIIETNKSIKETNTTNTKIIKYQIGIAVLTLIALIASIVIPLTHPEPKLNLDEKTIQLIFDRIDSVQNRKSSDN